MKNHTACMQIFNDAGIYVMSDLGRPAHEMCANKVR